MSGSFAPESRIRSQLITGLNQATDIVAKDFAKHFVYLRGQQLASYESAELESHIESLAAQLNETLQRINLKKEILRKLEA